MSVEKFSGLVGSIYDAALDPSLWRATLQELVTAFSGSGGALIATVRGSHQASHASVGKDHAAVANYNTYYASMDPVAAALERTPAGTVLGCWDIVAPGEQRRSEFFNDWAGPLDIGDGIAANIIRDGSNSAWLGIGAPFRSEPYASPERVRLLRLLVPHLQRAMHVQLSLDTAELRQRSAFETLDRLAHGVVLFDPGGSVLFANRAALRIGASQEGLTIDHAGIHAALRDEDAGLQRLIGVAKGREGGLRTGGTLTLTRPSDPPFVVHVLPTEAGDGELLPAGTLVVIVDPAREPPALAPMLRRLYGLTQAEATVAYEVLRGEGLQSVADRMSVSHSTVRTHLQRVFDKTRTHRQAELARLLLTLEAGLQYSERLL